MAESSFAQSNGPSVTGEPDDDYDPVLDVSDDNELPNVPARPVAKRKRGRPRKEPLSKAAKTKETCANSKANATIYLLEAQKHLRLKDKQAGKAGCETAASPYSCWVHQHWKLSEVGEYGEEVTPNNFAKLQIVKPVMVCKHCSKTMSWAPSMNRKKHFVPHVQRICSYRCL
jgi:hypothetical protein